jgi:hypothetical protein
MKIYFALLVFTSFLTFSACQISHITQAEPYSNLPQCMASAVSEAFRTLRVLNCPQTAPNLAASCLCSKSANSQSFVSMVSSTGSLGCGTAAASEDVPSGIAVFSTYCEMAASVTVDLTPGAISTSSTSSSKG